MSGFFHPVLRLPLAVALAIFAGWHFFPGSAVDSGFFKLVALSQANPPFFTSGEGTHEKPWQLRTLASRQLPDQSSAPLIVSLGDDTGAFFQSSPPSPIDMAVILSNFQRLGAKDAATAAVMAWDEPDPIGLAALDKVLGRFESLVMATPLTRGAVADPMPEAYRNASLPLSHVKGEVSALPVVNRIPLSGVILGRENTRAGFQWIDHEEKSGFPPLLARWDDRVVFGFPLLVALQRFDLPLEGMEIRLGEFLRLAPQGAVVPLDRFGRMTSVPEDMSPYAELPAELLIDGGDDLFPKTAPRPVVLSDDRTTAEDQTRDFSQKLPAMISLITSDRSLVPERSFLRFTTSQEIVLLSLCMVGILVISRMGSYARNSALIMLMACIVGLHFIGASFASWMPSLPALGGVALALLLTRFEWFAGAYREAAGQAE